MNCNNVIYKYVETPQIHTFTFKMNFFQGLPLSLVPTGPVSYTHLDVYKRQLTIRVSASFSYS